jgi:hypothetical protein
MDLYLISFDEKLGKLNFETFNTIYRNFNTEFKAALQESDSRENTQRRKKYRAR